MKIKEYENYESWLDKAREYELNIALKKLAKGDDPAQVMDDMSRRLLEKALHPILVAIKEDAIKPYDAEKSRKEYEEKYKKDGLKKVADHVDGNLFDKDK